MKQHPLSLAGIFCLALLLCPLLTHARNVSITLGDIDGGVYDGPGSVDHVYIDPNWLAQHGSTRSFDIAKKDVAIPFTFKWTMLPGEVVSSAVLTAGIRGADSKVYSDNVRLEVMDTADKYDYAAMGWTPIPTDSVTVRSMVLQSALSRNLLPDLQDGQLNGNFADDTLVDYVTLDLTIIPAPTGDINQDGFIGLTDLDFILQNWNQDVTPYGILNGELTGDGYVGLDDLDVMLSNWNAGTAPALDDSAITPEPAAFTVFLLGSLACLKRSGDNRTT